MPDEVFDITSGERRVVHLVSPITASQALARVESCEACTPEIAETLFDRILGTITGLFNADESLAHHLVLPLVCPNCGDNVTEDTLVKQKGRP